MDNKKKHYVKRKLDHLELVCREIQKYNKENGTNYSYGQYVGLVYEGKIKSELIHSRR